MLYIMNQEISQAVSHCKLAFSASQSPPHMGKWESLHTSKFTVAPN